MWFCCSHVLYSRDTSLKVWSLHTFEMLHHMGGHTGVVTCVRLVPESAGKSVKVMSAITSLFVITEDILFY